MGFLDHKRTWHYDVRASSDECIAAFERAFTTHRGMIRAEWNVSRQGRGAVAVYQGRRGIGALGSITSRTAAQEMDTALGSEVTFQIDQRANDERTACSMWLSSSGRSGIGGLLGATSDARFIRQYMQAVEKEMRKLDPSARVTTGS